MAVAVEMDVEMVSLVEMVAVAHLSSSFFSFSAAVVTHQVSVVITTVAVVVREITHAVAAAIADASIGVNSGEGLLKQPLTIFYIIYRIYSYFHKQKHRLNQTDVYLELP